MKLVEALNAEDHDLHDLYEAVRDAEALEEHNGHPQYPFPRGGRLRGRNFLSRGHAPPFKWRATACRCNEVIELAEQELREAARQAVD